MSDEIKSQLINFYLNLKSQTQIKNNLNSSSDEKIEKETKMLKESSIESIGSLLKESIAILISKDLKTNSNSKFDSSSNLPNEKIQETIEKESQSKYEKCLRKLEQDIRNHIKIEYELKIHNDFLKSKIENLENQFKGKNFSSDKEKYFTEDTLNYQYSPTTDKKENEILILRAENTNLKSTVEKLEKSEKKFQELCEKYLMEIKNLKEQKEKKKFCNCEDLTKKYQKLYEDYLLLSSQNEFYNKMFRNLNRKTSPLLKETFGLYKSQDSSFEPKSYRFSSNDMDSKILLSNSNKFLSTNKELKNEEMTLTNLKKFNSMVKKHHSIDLNLEKISSDRSKLLSSSSSGVFANQSQNLNKNFHFKVNSMNNKLKDTSNTNNLSENISLNLRSLRNFQGSSIQNGVNCTGLFNVRKINEINSKNSISQKMQKISSTLNLKSISNI